MSEIIAQIDRLIEVGQYARAKGLLERAFSEAPNDPDAHVCAARIALEEKDVAAAQQHVAEALAANPLHFGARLLQFFVSLRERRYAEAEQTIIALIRERPGNADLYALYARLMLFAADVKKAGALVAEAIRIDPDNREARLEAVLVATVRGKPGLANAQLADLIALHPQNREVAATLFIALIDQGRRREALSVGQQILRGDPDNRALVDVLIRLRASTHWLALPSYPLLRWGWPASAIAWAGAIVVIGTLRNIAPKWAAVFGVVYLAWAIHSWIHAPLLKRWIAWRGL